MEQHIEQGLAIRAARISRNMTQAHLAGLAGISEKTVRRAESGERIAADSVRSLCAALGLDAENLRSESEMIPQSEIDLQERLQLRALSTKLAVSILALSFTLTLAYVIFGGFPIPTGLDRVLQWVFASGGAIGVLVLILALIPATRQRLLDFPLGETLRTGLGLGMAALSFVVVVGMLPPSLCIALYMLKGLIAEPTWTGAGFALLFGYMAVDMVARLLPVISGEAMDESPAAAERRPAPGKTAEV